MQYSTSLVAFFLALEVGMRKSGGGGGGALKIHRSNNGGMSFNLWTALLLPFFSVVTEIETIRAAFFWVGTWEQRALLKTRWRWSKQPQKLLPVGHDSGGIDVFVPKKE